MATSIVRADARSIPLADASVDLIVTSPPYYGLRSYQDGGEHYRGQIGAEPTPAEYVAALLECTREWMRVLKPEGSIFVNLGDKYSQRSTARRSSHQDGLFPNRPELKKAWRRDREAGLARMPRENIIDPNTGAYVPEKSLMLLPERYRIGCVDQLGLIVRAVIIWSKASGMPSSATDRVRNTHEDWIHLTKRRRYFGAIDGLPPGSVWEIAAQPLRVPDYVAHTSCCGSRKRPDCEAGLRHDAAFPLELPRRIITGWSPVGGVVLDPFGGTGTTALVADALGRHGVSIDRSADYCRLAVWRTSDSGERARALGVAKPPPVIDGQGDLFSSIT